MLGVLKIVFLMIGILIAAVCVLLLIGILSLALGIGVTWKDATGKGVNVFIQCTVEASFISILGIMCLVMAGIGIYGCYVGIEWKYLCERIPETSPILEPGDTV